MNGDREEPKINGPDDAIAILGDAALWSIIDSAPLSEESARRDAEDAIRNLRSQRELTKSKPAEVVILNCDDAIESVAAIADEQERALFVGQLAAVRIPGLNKALIEKEIRNERKAMSEELDEAREVIQRERYMRVADSPLRLVRDLAQYYALWRGIPPGAEVIEAVFSMNTYTYDVFDTTPYMLYDSATPGCGKTISEERHEAVCAKSHLCASPSSAVIFRRIDRDHGTLILDEAKWVQGNWERAAEVTEIFDVGYKRGGKVSRCAEHGERLVDFDVFCPKVMARIGNFSGTLLSRGVLFHLTKTFGLPQSWSRRIKVLAAPLKERLKAYAVQHRKALEEMYERMPDETYWKWISGRENELYTPLLMHARLIGCLCGDEGKQFEGEFEDIVRRFTAEKVKLVVVEDWRVGEALEILEILEQRLKTLLLVKDSGLEKWQESTTNRITARDLLGELQEKELWGAYLEKKKKNDRAKATSIGIFLRSFGPKSRHTETGTEYVLLDLARKLARHIPPELPEPAVDERDEPQENFRTLLGRFEENLTDTSFPGASDTPSPGNSHTHDVDPDSRNGLEVSDATATASSEKSYRLTPQLDSERPEVSAEVKVSADNRARTDTLTPEESRNFGGVSPKCPLNEVVGDNPDTLTPFSPVEPASSVSPIAEASPEAGEVAPGTKEMFPEANQSDSKQEDSGDRPDRSGDTEGYL